MGTNKRVALKPHKARIRGWVEAGKTDDWIADALGTSASSVQSFRSRNDIHRRERGPREPESVFEAMLDNGEEGCGLWIDPTIAEDPIWREHWAGVDAVVVKVAEDSIVLEPDAVEPNDGDTDVEALTANSNNGQAEKAPPLLPREQGRVKWFDPEKGYGFLVRPTGEDLFVHRSGVEADPAELTPRTEVEYGVGRNDRGPVAVGVRPG